MASIKIATWNINSVRLRIELVEKLLQEQKIDVLCLQETKCPNDAFPEKALHKIGYEHIAKHGQKGYHGVAIISRIPLEDVKMRVFCEKDDTRHIAATIAGTDGVRIHNFYVPAGGDEPNPEINEKFAHKLQFMDEMISWYKNHKNKKTNKLIVVGDLNIAPLEEDVWSHKKLLKVISHTPVEVDLFEKFMASHSWLDVMREFVPSTDKLYTWWSYRSKDWRVSNKGRRLDHVLTTPALEGKTTSMTVFSDARSWERPSDHAPVIFDLDIS